MSPQLAIALHRRGLYAAQPKRPVDNAHRYAVQRIAPMVQDFTTEGLRARAEKARHRSPWQRLRAWIRERLLP